LATGSTKFQIEEGKEMEKRIPIAIVVHLARVGHQTAESAELTFTDNISAHGACVISARHWKAGEMAEVTSLNDKIMLVGRVTYCQKRADARYGVGLNFRDREVTWDPYAKHAGPQVVQSLGSGFRQLARTA
jgi:hypothetical protein